MLYPIFRERFTSQHPVGRVRRGSSASVSGASRLMRLPNELLVQIWTYMSLKDIETLSLVNRHFHNLGHQYIQEHRRLKQRYLRVENALPYGWNSAPAEPSPKKLIGHSLIRMFTDLYENPSARGYVEEIIINGWMQTWNNRESCRKEEKARLKDTKSSFHTVKAHVDSLTIPFKYRKFNIMGDSWESARSMDQIMQGDEDSLLALLLTIAPNVHTIHFKSYREEPSAMLALIEAVAGAEEMAQIEATTEDVSIPFLTQLSKVTFNARDIEAEFDMSALHAFAILPSVRQIHAYHVSEIGLWWEQWDGAMPHFEGYRSNVRDITLSYVNMYWCSLENLLCLCEKLQTFVYEPCDPCTCYIGTYFRFAPDKIRQALFVSARHSLRSLKIHSHRRVRRYMGSFKEFQVLAVLDTDWGLLKNNNRPRRQILTDTLPPSIEEVHLVSGIDTTIDVSIDALQHLIASKTRHFPALKAIHLKHTRLLHVVETELVSTAKSRRVTITFDRSANPDVRPDEEDDEDDDDQWYSEETDYLLFTNEDDPCDHSKYPMESYFPYQKPD
ncbi:hypothetical protein G7Y79_00002g007920 [Physcia stellaris]|nr:hypothetical protein G7Y79_00002g007920 [Physcia stellaris]